MLPASANCLYAARLFAVFQYAATGKILTEKLTMFYILIIDAGVKYEAE